MNYAAAAATGLKRPQDSTHPKAQEKNLTTTTQPHDDSTTTTTSSSANPSSHHPHNPAHPHPKRAPSPSHIPKTTHPNESLYILTLQTDPAHHARLTAVRKTYFPSHLNKLDAHLTLFHALPASQLTDSIVPALETVARSTQRFEVHAAQPMRLRRGIAIAVPRGKGGGEVDALRERLRERWSGEGWLSVQDAARGGRVHYTIMNKVEEDEVVERAWREVREGWRVDVGIAEGLGLWRYEKGWWKWERGFEFSA